MLVSFIAFPTLWDIPFTSTIEYVNDISFGIDATVNVPLYPKLSNPIVFVVLWTFLITTISPICKLWGFSAIAVTVFAATVQVLMNLGFLL